MTASITPRDDYWRNGLSESNCLRRSQNLVDERFALDATMHTTPGDTLVLSQPLIL